MFPDRNSFNSSNQEIRGFVGYTPQKMTPRPQSLRRQMSMCQTRGEKDHRSEFGVETGIAISGFVDQAFLAFLGISPQKTEVNQDQDLPVLTRREMPIFDPF